MTVLPAKRSSLPRAVRILRAGGVVVFPTETSYGLAADPKIPGARHRLDQVKGQSSRKSVSVIASDLAMVERWCFLSARERRIAKKLWPGPLTLILQPRSKAPRSISSRFGLAIRVPGLSFARDLAKSYGSPLTATSANISGSSSVFSVSQMKRQFFRHEHRPDLFLNAGPLPRRRASTLARINAYGIKIFRAGPVGLQKLERVIE